MPATITELTGVFVNGHIVPDARPLPDGTRVRFRVVAEDADEHADDEVEDCPPILGEPYDRASELAILREAYSDVLADRGGVPHAVVMAELAAEFGVPIPKRAE